jgi:hypothetical protein
MTIVKELPIKWVAIVLSLLLSIWVQYLDDIINTDGFIHLGAAESIVESGWTAAMSKHNVPPLYPAMIAGAHKLTGLSFESSAMLISQVSYLIIVLAFLSIIQQVSTDRRVHWCALLIILAHPELNDLRCAVYKDASYWALYLSALVFFIRYYQRQRLVDALLWNILILISMLFRAEGIVFFLGLPLVLLFNKGHTWKQRRWYFIKLNIFPVVCLLLMGGLLADKVSHLWGALKPWAWVQFVMGEDSSFVLKANLLRQQIGVGEWTSYFMLLMMIFILVVYKTMNTLGVFYNGLLFIGVWAKPVIPKVLFQVVIAAVILNVCLLSLYSAKWYFLQARYTTGLGLSLMLVLPFVLIWMWDYWVDKGIYRKWLVAFFLLAFTYVVGDSLTKIGSSKLYLKEAGLWVKENRKGLTVFLNDDTLRYYSGERMTHHVFYNMNTLVTELTNSQKRYQLVALSVRKKYQFDMLRLQEILGDPIKTFQNKKGDRVLVFEKSDGYGY